MSPDRGREERDEGLRDGDEKGCREGHREEETAVITQINTWGLSV